MHSAIAVAPTTSLATERARAARGVLATSALLGVTADVALRNLSGGLGWTLWVAALAGAALNVARRSSILTVEQIVWLGAAFVCAAAFAWRDAGDLRVANVLGTLVAIAMFAPAVVTMTAINLGTLGWAILAVMFGAAAAGVVLIARRAARDAAAIG